MGSLPPLVVFWPRFRHLAFSRASACSFLLLSPRRGDVGGEISWETCFLRTFHGYVQGLTRVPLKQRCLPIHRRGDEADFQRRPELRIFCPYTLVVDLAGLPPAVQVLNPLTCESGLGFVEKEEVSVGQLAVILGVPGPARSEVIEQTMGAVRVPELLESREKELLSAGEVRVAGSDVIESDLGELHEKSQVGVHMGLEAIQAFKAGIDETECHHRGRRSLGVVEHGEFIDEIAVGEVVLDGPGITLGGQDFLFDSELIAEVAQLLLLGFEVGVVVVPENEVEGNEPRADVFGRVLTAEADIVPADGFIEIPREKVIDAAIPQVFLGTGVLLFGDFAGKGHAALARLGLDELQELLAGEVARMRGHQVEETGFLLGVAEVHKGLGKNGKDFHSAKILAVISWVSRRRRSLAWSCCRAKRWNPALAFSASPWGR